MLLDKIKLVGFKSFVDPTPIHFPSTLVGIVGPNGCGKSNVIDAVRWVMGESAASRLRGEQGTDVIFNGSGGRQPLGQASVELIFDNSDASLGGEYAQYAEISIRRVVTRDGISSYFLNNTRCRRKDIADIFLGTGLGPRSYAIIQQGTVSRIIEAKPEELRQFLEEAAGISKYKERRKETETRIRGARENLERLQDVRLELNKQLATLKRQAAAAERFTELKAEQRNTKAELFALRWKAINEKLSTFQAKITTQETELIVATSEIQHSETKIEHTRLAHTEAVDEFNAQQSQYYRTHSELSKVEQEIKHQQERQQQLNDDLQITESQRQSLSTNLEHDKQHKIELQQTLDKLLPELALTEENSQQAHIELEALEYALNIWQQAWNDFRDQFAKISQTAEVEQARIHQFEDRILSLNNKIQKSEQSLSEINLSPGEEKITELTTQLQQERDTAAQIQHALNDNKTLTQALQQQSRELMHKLDQTKHERQKLEGKKVSLEVLQSAVLSTQDQKTKHWLNEQGLQQNSHLAKNIQVDNGWEHAVETVLENFLQSICVDATGQHYATSLTNLKQDVITLISPHKSTSITAEKLISKVKGAYLPSYFSAIYAVETLEEALQKQDALLEYESVITKEGLWLGKNWMRVAHEKNAAQGVLEREKELKHIVAEIKKTESLLTQHQISYEDLQEQLHQQQSQTESLQQHYQQTHSRLNRAEADLTVQQRMLDQAIARRDMIQNEITEQRQESQQLKQQLEQSRHLWSDALESLENLEAEKQKLETEKDEKFSSVQYAREKNQRIKNNLHEITVKKNMLEVELRSLEKNIVQLSQQLHVLDERKQQLILNLSQGGTPIDLLEEQHQQLLEASFDAEQQLNQSREKMNVIESQQRELEKGLRETEQKAHGIQSSIQNTKLEMEGLHVRKQTLEEQLSELEQQAEAVLSAMAEIKEISQLEEQLEHIERRIERLGPINLVAIEECKEKEERKVYYDAQNADLEEALRALEDAMAKIDKETRAKFRETFDTVNATFNTLFPKIFGGGNAALTLTGTDLLDTGVEVMAQPPGKKNSSIHLLSGGEKTMVAIALVFSIFQLNPAPFCMLDEVDAPLDDANVLRFCGLVREMSQKVQFIVITHNKVTMEMMHQLMGVTMNEPGVSRIVSVDIKEAAELVE